MTYSPLFGIVTVILFASVSQAATTALYWDPDGTTPGTGGTGTWINLDSSSEFWTSNSGGTTGHRAWDNSKNDIAIFQGTPGTVTLSGPINAAQIQFSAGGYTLQNSALTLTPTAASSQLVYVNPSTTGTTTFSSPIVVNATAFVGSEVKARIVNASSSQLVIDGDLSFYYASGTLGSTSRYLFNQSGSGSIVINGAIGATTGGATGSKPVTIRFGEGDAAATDATYYLNAANTGNLSAVDILRGTVYLGSDSGLGTGTVTLGGGNADANNTAKLLVNGARTITNAIANSNNPSNPNLSTLHHEIGGNTAHLVTFSGQVNIRQPNLTVSAVSGGRVNISGEVRTSADGTWGNLIKDGDGIVALTRVAGNTYGNSGKSSTIVTKGTLLLMNESGSATSTSPVLVKSGAALGGSGFATSPVTSEGATSSFTPGDMTLAGISGIGNLSLTGGFSATAGATFHIDINGNQIDTLSWGAGTVALGGVTTFTFTSLGSVNVGTPYSLFLGTGAWSGSPNFVFNAPTGYLLDTAYQSGGYRWDAANHSFTVQFAAVPEPSSLLLAAGAAVALCLVRRRAK